jgi:hypothetical protein
MRGSPRQCLGVAEHACSHGRGWSLASNFCSATVETTGACTARLRDLNENLPRQTAAESFARIEFLDQRDAAVAQTCCLRSGAEAPEQPRASKTEGSAMKQDAEVSS